MKEKTALVGDILKREDSRTVRLDELCLTYSLYGVTLNSLRRYYAIGIETENDGAFVAVGTDEHMAATLYERLCELLVTPCTLEDIVSDIRAENRIGY